MSEASPKGRPEVVEDLVLTDAFLIKGRVDGKFARLVNVLNSWKKDFLVVSSALMIDLRRGEEIRTPRVHVHTGELVLAHELVDGAGDYYQKMLSDGSEPDRTRIRTFCHGQISLELAGWIRPGAYEGQAAKEQRFFVMENCTVRGLDLDVSPELAILTKLPYAIVNRCRIAYLYDFTECG